MKIGPKRARELIGRTIVGVELREFDNGRRGKACNPMLRLDDGRVLFFIVQETEVGEYGIALELIGKRRK